MTITAAPTGHPALDYEKQHVDARIANTDTDGLRHRLAMNAKDRGTWYGELPFTKAWLDYEREAIEAELRRRTQ